MVTTVLRYSNMPPEVLNSVFGRGARRWGWSYCSGPIAACRSTSRRCGMRADAIHGGHGGIREWTAPTRMIERMRSRAGRVSYMGMMPLMHGGHAIGHLAIAREEDRPFDDFEADFIHASRSRWRHLDSCSVGGRWRGSTTSCRRS